MKLENNQGIEKMKKPTPSLWLKATRPQNPQIQNPKKEA
jgi:hypothetical protein